MRIAFLADIHANLEALNACLANARACSVERLVFLGDIVGYGADPVACLDLVQEACSKGATIVRGNHDEAVLAGTATMNSAAAAAVRWTEAVLRPDQKEFLARLPLKVVEDDRLYVHASARSAETYPYVRGLREAGDSLMATDARLTVCGHVHQPALYHIAPTGKVMGFIPVTASPIPLSYRRRWLAVMGSVGQPRDGNPAAAYGILDTKSSDLAIIRVPYDVEKASAKIRSAGLPDDLWKRLGLGR